MRGVERSVWAVPGRGNSICQVTEAAVDVKRMIFSVEWEQIALQGKKSWLRRKTAFMAQIGKHCVILRRGIRNGQGERRTEEMS